MGKKELIVKCTDNCSAMSIDHWENEEDYFIAFYKSHKKSFFYRLKEAFKYILGKDIIEVEIVLNKEEFNQIRKF